MFASMKNLLILFFLLFSIAAKADDNFAADAAGQYLL
jgi:hypothetical protein